MTSNSKFKHTTNKQKKLVGTFNATRHKKAIAEKIDQSKDVIVSKSEERLLISSTYDKAQIELFNDIMQLLEVSGTKQKVGIRFVDMFYGCQAQCRKKRISDISADEVRRHHKKKSGH